MASTVVIDRPLSRPKLVPPDDEIRQELVGLQPDSEIANGEGEIESTMPPAKQSFNLPYVLLTIIVGLSVTVIGGLMMVSKWQGAMEEKLNHQVERYNEVKAAKDIQDTYIFNMRERVIALEQADKLRQQQVQEKRR